MLYRLNMRLLNYKWWQIPLIALTRLLNFLTGGSITKSFSARVGKLSFENDVKWAKIAEKIINALLWFHKDHCYKEYLNEYGD